MPQLSLHSPIGDLTVFEEAGEIITPDWGWGRDDTAMSLLVRAKTALQDHFDGVPLARDLPLNPGGPAYWQCVWQALRQIPVGHTRSYIELQGSRAAHRVRSRDQCGEPDCDFHSVSVWLATKEKLALD